MATTRRRKQAAPGAPSRPNSPERTQPAEEPTLAAFVAPDPADSASADAAQMPAQSHEPQPIPALAAEPPKPTPSAPAEAAPVSPAAERAAFMRGRALMLAGLVLAIVVIAFLANRAFGPQAALTPVESSPTEAPATPAASATPGASATPEPAAAAPVIAANPTATPAPQPGAGIACSQIAGLPVFAGATCTDQDRDSDDGVIKFENTYMAAATADEVRRFYEGAFAQTGWTLGKFKYDINLGQRRVQIEVETEQAASGAITTVQLTEHGAATPASTSCAPIAGLPALPNATCIKFDTDQDDGVFKTESTYSTTASPENVWRFYESALTQSGWAGQEFQYNLQQGPSRVEINVEAQEAPGNVTKFKIAEK